MKQRMLLLAAPLVLIALIILEGCATNRYVSKTDEEIYGTWINPAPPNGMQKTTTLPNGWENYYLILDATPCEKGTQEITSKWKDAEGNTWFKTTATITASPALPKGQKVQTLQKVDKSGRVREWVAVLVTEFDPTRYPKSIGADQGPSGFYALYYRK
jgi:hypothetical protein